MNWLQQITAQSPELINVKYLFERQMSPANVSGEIAELQDAIPGISGGTLAVMLDEGPDYMIVALPSGIFGFAPFKTNPRLWTKTGKPFIGGPDELTQISNENVGVLDLSTQQEVINELRTATGFREIFISPSEIRAVYYEDPQGPGGYRSQYQITLSTHGPSSGPLVSIAITCDREVKSIKVNQEELLEMVKAATIYMKMMCA